MSLPIRSLVHKLATAKSGGPTAGTEGATSLTQPSLPRCMNLLFLAILEGSEESHEILDDPSDDRDHTEAD
jgi:hypothetical protein